MNNHYDPSDGDFDSLENGEIAATPKAQKCSLRVLSIEAQPNSPQWVVCPFAGGSNSAFRSWRALENICVKLFTYPGRDHRLKHELVSSIEQLAHELADAILDDPSLQHNRYILCGHSMGAQVAYEACLRLEKHHKAPQALVLSGCHAPHLTSRRLLGHLADQEFINELINIGGCSPELARNASLFDLFLPMLRADFVATENYSKARPSNASMLNTSTILVRGTEDTEAYEEEVEAWRSWIVAGKAQSVSILGGHFYITEDPDSFTQAVDGCIPVNRVNGDSGTNPRADTEATAVSCKPLLHDRLNQWAHTYGHAMALIEGPESVTYAQLKRRVDGLASGLHCLGLNSGDHAIIQLPNGVEFVVVFFALCQLGVIPILTMPTQGEKDIAELADITQPRAYFIGENSFQVNYRLRAENLQQRIPQLQHIIISSENAVEETGGSNELFQCLSGLEVAPVARGVPVYSDIALLLISGGTTGTPKLIARTHRDYAYNFLESAKVCGLDVSSVYLAVLPAAHNFTLACPGILGVLSAGGKVVFSKYPDPKEAMPLIERFGVTHTALIPVLAELWQGARDWQSSDLSSLRCLQVGGAKLNSTLAKKLLDRVGPVQQVFGMAEGLLCYTRLDDPINLVCDTQGYPLSAQDQIRVVDQNLSDVPEGQEGELLTRGPYTITGYYRAEQHNKRAFTADGFYRTGDLVRQLPGGYLKVVGRIKEQINRNGEKLSIAEIEHLIQGIPGVREVILMGIPDDILGERSCAVIIAKQQATLTADAVRRNLLDKGLSGYKIPDQFEFIQQWPLTAVGKVDRKKLSERLSQTGSLPEALDS